MQFRHQFQVGDQRAQFGGRAQVQPRTLVEVKGLIEAVGLYAQQVAVLAALEQDLTARRFGYRYTHALDLAAQGRIWSLREAALGLSMAMREDAKSLSFVEDTAVAPSRG